MAHILVNSSVTSIAGIGALANYEALTITETGSVFSPAAGYNTGASYGLLVTVAGFLQANAFQIGGTYGTFRLTETGVANLSTGLLTEAFADITIAGSLFSETWAISTLGNSFVEVTGTVKGGGIGVVLNAGGGTNDTLVNHGLISARDNYGVQVQSAGPASIRNHGIIEGLGNNPSFSPAAIGLEGAVSLVNTGTIAGGLTAIQTGSALTALELDNSGLIQAADYGLRFYYSLPLASVVIHNSGKIIADTAIYGQGEALQLQNSGVIRGLVQMGSGTDLLDTSNGTIRGMITLGDGDDVLLAFGAELTGEVHGGNGNDGYYVDGDVTIIETALTGGTDTVYARSSHDLADNVENLRLLGTSAYDGRGNGGANDIAGNSGANRLFGLAGNDTMTGGHGDDDVQGGGGTDSLNGNDGDDTVRGGIGTDTLRGEDGDDVLIGGAGKDYMVGGAQSDRFIFQVLTHSAIAQADADTIADFVQGEDLIDLSAIDANRGNTLADDAFTFIGTTAFSNVAGQLRYLQSGGNTFLQLDVNGDSLADATIRLNGLIALNAGDLIL